MATAGKVSLIAGNQYSLANCVHKQDSLEPNLTVIHVKLTDSALKAIEEFHKSKRINRNAKIQFQGNQGVINIPFQQNSAEEVEQRSFAFTLSSLIAEQKDGSIDCIQQSCKKSEQLLESLGPFSQKLVVQASDDVYQATLVKMNMAEQESKKVCTKEIKPSGPNFNKIKRLRQAERPLPIRTPLSDLKKEIPDSLAGTLNATSNLKRKPVANKTNPLISNVPKRLKGSPHQIPSGMRRQTQALSDLPYNSPAISPCHSSPSVPNKNSSPNPNSASYPQPLKKTRISHFRKNEPSPASSEAELRPTRKVLNGASTKASNQDAACVTSTTTARNTEDYESYYQPIVNESQRSKYKEDFNTEYKEYRSLHSSIEQRLKPLNSLIEKLQKEVKDSPEYEKIKELICDEHSLLKTEIKHENDRSRCDYLHKKLAYIKQLVHDYDTRHIAVSKK